MADRQPIEADDQDAPKQAVQPLDYYVPPKPAPAIPVPLWMAPVVAGECLLFLILILLGITGLMDGVSSPASPLGERRIWVLVCTGCASWLAAGMYFGIMEGSRTANYGLVVLMLCFSGLGVVLALSNAGREDPVPIILAVSALGTAIAHFCLARASTDD